MAGDANRRRRIKQTINSRFAAAALQRVLIRLTAAKGRSLILDIIAVAAYGLYLKAG
jgi:hypothetical protein